MANQIDWVLVNNGDVKSYNVVPNKPSSKRNWFLINN